MSATPKGKFRVVGGIAVSDQEEFFVVQGEAGDVIALSPRKAYAEWIVNAIRQAQETEAERKLADALGEAYEG